MRRNSVNLSGSKPVLFERAINLLRPNVFKPLRLAVSRRDRLRRFDQMRLARSASHLCVLSREKLD
jgi:hypothetical protein